MPSDRVAFLTQDEVLAIHARLIEAFGGATGVRDLGLLDSALYRPQTGYYEDLVEMAAALFESLVMNHPFFDGDKRVAFFASDVFLRMNGWLIEVDPDEAHAFVTKGLERGDLGLDQLRAWVREHARPLG